MQTTEKPTAAKNSVSGTLFGFGLLLIVIALVTFLFDWKWSGLMFSVGMAASLTTCVVSALLGEKTSPGELLTMAVGAAFFIWLALHNL